MIYLWNIIKFEAFKQSNEVLIEFPERILKLCVVSLLLFLSQREIFYTLNIIALAMYRHNNEVCLIHMHSIDLDIKKKKKLLVHENK